MATPAPMPEDPNGQPMDDPVRGPSFWLEHAKRYGEIERYLESEAVLRKGLALFPEDASLHANLSWTLYRLGRYQEASGEARSALSTQCDLVLAQYVLTLIAINDGRKFAAIKLANDGLTRNPNNTDLTLAKGLALNDLGRHAKAIAEFQSVIADDPASLCARFHLGKAMLGMGDCRSASREIEELRRLHPTEAMTHELIGRLAYDNGRIDDAIKHYKESLNLCPNDKEVQQLLAIAESASSWIARPFYLLAISSAHHPLIVVIAAVLLIAFLFIL